MGDGAISEIPGKSRREPKIGSGKDSSEVVQNVARWAVGYKSVDRRELSEVVGFW